MFLFEPGRTPYDWNWRLFGIDVRVHPMFWLIGAIMGMSTLDLGFQYLLVWLGCFFISILIHELGHIWMGQVFGSYGHIVLYGFGGLAIGSNNVVRPWRRIAVSFAGPLAGFLLVGSLFLCMRLLDPMRFDLYLEIVKLELGLHQLLGLRVDAEMLPHLLQILGVGLEPPHVGDFALRNLIYINILWGLLNLLPIWPLDGGQISRDLCKLASPGRGLRISLGISFVTAALLALHSIMRVNGMPLLPFLPIGSKWSAIFFSLFAVESFMLLQQTQRRERDFDDWERDPEIWGR